MSTLQETINLLENNQERPSSEEALNVSEKELNNAASKMGSIIVPRGDYIDTHNEALPIMENMIDWLIQETEGDGTRYYIFARDAEMAYDALWGKLGGKTKDLSEKLTLINTSLGMRDPNPEYFHQMGLNDQEIKNGLNPVFIDSGFRGSMFDKVKSWSKINEKSRKTIRGFLFSKIDTSPYLSINFLNNLTPQELEKFENQSKKVHNVEYTNYSNFTSFEKRRGYAICAYMQTTPKATNRFIKTVQNKEGQWKSIPEESFLDHSNYLCNNRSPTFVNADIVDPVIALALQQLTLKYFSK
jgi:hypothetical protein